MKNISALICLTFTLLTFYAHAQVTVSNNGDAACVGSFVIISDIVITENAVTDFAIDGTPRTILIGAGGNQFNAGVGTVTFSDPGVQANIGITGSTITVTLYETSPGHESSLNTLTISGIEVMPGGLFGWTINETGGDLVVNGLSGSGGPVASVFGYNPPTIADAGITQTACVSALLSANSPTDGTGTWTSSPSEGVSFSNVNDPTATFTAPAGGYSLTWTITNGPCTPSTSSVEIFIDELPTIANAGTDQTACSEGGALLSANIPTVGTGEWSSSPPGASFSDIYDPNTNFTGAEGTYSIYWTITNGTCVASTDDAFITLEGSPTTPSAGPNATECGAFYMLSGNLPTSGVGLWTSSPSEISFSDATDPNATFEGIPGNAYTLTWQISNTCGVGTSNMTLTLDELPSDAAPGDDQAVCGTSTLLEANSPTVGTGAWTVFPLTGASFGDAGDPNTSFSGDDGVTYTLTWTITNGVCGPSSDDVLITLYDNPTVADAGFPQTLCATSTALSANTPLIGTGSWSIESGGGGSFTDGSDPLTNFDGVAGTAYNLRWSVVNGTCPPSYADVSIVFEAPPTPSNAGADLDVCGTATGPLAANSPAVGTGLWIASPSEGVSFSDAADPNATFTGMPASTYTLTWGITNGTCPPEMDDLVVTFHDPPSASAAGSDQTLCATNSTALSANNPSVGSGVWSATPGGGTFVDPFDPGTNFTGTLGVAYTLTWTISNGACADATDDVSVAFDDLPTTSAAGDDLAVCTAGALMTANVPTVGTGTWSIISGTGGSFSDEGDPAGTFSGAEGETYVLRWTITNGSCTASLDDVTVMFEQQPDVSNAGPDASSCGMNITLDANAPAVGTGEWSITSGSGGGFTDANDPATAFNGLQGETYVLAWTITSGSCAPSFDEVTIVLDENPTAAFAGPDQALCTTSTILDANSPAVGSASWTVLSGSGGVLYDPGDPVSSIDGLSGETYELEWRIVSGSCLPSADTVVVVFNPLPAGADELQPICSGAPLSYDLQENIDSHGNAIESSFVWIAAPNANVSGESLAASPAPSINDGLLNATNVDQAVLYQVTPTSLAGCAGNPFTITVTVHPLPAMDPTLDRSVCSDEAAGITLASDGATTPAAMFAISSINAGSLTPNPGNAVPGPMHAASSIENDIFTNNSSSPEIVEYDVTPVSIEGCEGPAIEIFLTVNPVPVITITNATPSIASGQATNVSLASSLAGSTFTFSADAPPQISGAVPGAGNSIVQTLTNASTSAHIVVYTASAISAEGCVSVEGTTEVTVEGLITTTVIVSDSLALVAIYNSLGGNAWIVTTNWLTNDVNTWHGVSVVSQRVTGLILPGNNLQGSLPPELAALDAMLDLDLSNNALGGIVENLPPSVTTLNVRNNMFHTLNTIPVATLSVDISGNALHTLADLSSASLTTLDVSDNQLTFEDLEANIGIPTFTYAPQDSVGVRQEALVDIGDTQNIIATIGGSSNVYEWFKNGSPIAGQITNTLTLAAIDTDDDAIYHYRATSPLVPGLTLNGRKFELKVSSLKRDSTALRLLYELTNGPQWTNNENWTSTDLADGWFGVTIENNRVTGIDLPGNNLNGAVPALLADIANLESVDLSGNAITKLPDLSTLTGLVNLNVSDNRLDFSSLEPNISIAGIQYENQAEIGTSSTVNIPAGSPHTLGVNSAGANNLYQWKLNNEVVPGAASATLNISAVNRSTMGAYVCEVSNSVVPGLTLSTAPSTVLAVSAISGTLLANVNGTPGTAGTITLLRVTASGGYDTTRVVQIASNGSFEMTDIVLDDYQLLGFLDKTQSQYEKAIPTYRGNTIFWEEADTIYIRESVIADLDIISQFEPDDEPGGQGVISGYVVEDDETGSGSGRVEAPKRVSNAGVSARRVERTGRGEEEEEILTLVAYQLTNENGEFEFTNLEVGEYRLNIQYPGYPMDATSFVTVPIGAGLASEKQVEAVVAVGKITVKELVLTDVWNAENYDVSVYPNPVSAFINLEFRSHVPSRVVEILDSAGKRVAQLRVPEKTALVDVRGVKSGQFIITIRENGNLMKTVHLVIH